MIESFSTLKKGDIVYILNLNDFSLKNSIVVEVDNNTIYTQYKDFSKSKMGGKINCPSIKEDGEYCSINKQEIQNELLWYKNKLETDMQDCGFMLKYIKTHDTESAINELQESYDRDKESVEHINATLGEF